MPVSLKRDRKETESPVSPESTGNRVSRAAVEAVLQGDPEPFGILVDRYQQRLFSLLLMLTRDPTGAEEVAQEAFVRAFQKLDLYDLDRPFYPWLATIGARLAQTWLKRRALRSQREGQESLPDKGPPVIKDPLENLINDEKSRRLWHAVQALPQGERTSVILHYRQELKIREIAHVLGVTGGTVKTWLFRARQHLKGALESAPACHKRNPK